MLCRYGEGRFYSSAGTAETFSQMLWKDTERLGCAMAVCRQGTAIACAYDPPGNVWGAYESNVQAVPGSASGMGRSVSDEELPPWLQEQARQQRAAEEGAEQPPEAARRGTPFIPAPGGPSSFIAASRKRAGELADPLQAPNLLLSAPTPALNFLTTPYSLPNFTVSPCAVGGIITFAAGYLCILATVCQQDEGRLAIHIHMHYY